LYVESTVTSEYAGASVTLLLGWIPCWVTPVTPLGSVAENERAQKADRNRINVANLDIIH
jgi:hypothetical protein